MLSVCGETTVHHIPPFSNVTNINFPHWIVFCSKFITWRQAGLNGQRVSNSFCRPSRTFQACAKVLKLRQEDVDNNITTLHGMRDPCHNPYEADHMIGFCNYPPVLKPPQQQSPTTTTPPRAPLLLLRSRGELAIHQQSPLLRKTYYKIQPYDGFLL